MTQSPSEPRPLLSRGLVPGLQDLAAASFGVTPESRQERFTSSLREAGADSASYWLQLSLATGIATLGLVLGSNAVVIGAMLVSPLMSPLVGLAMGLCSGSPLLVMRSLVRTLTSASGVIAAAALLTQLLPFQRVTQEIASRTSPTALDLAIAACCALAAGFSTARGPQKSGATAAGTAVGIALVPPLCVVGFCLGSGRHKLALGAGLLFVANLCAILLFAALFFVALGFNQVEVRAHEEQLLHETKPSSALASLLHSLQRLFASRSGPLVRFLMPIVLMAAIFIPLRRALSEVSWRVRVQSGVQELIADLPVETVRSRVELRRHKVDVQLVAVTKSGKVKGLEEKLTREIAALSGVLPRVRVLAVASANLWEAKDTESRREAWSFEAPTRRDLPATQVGEYLHEHWPVETAGRLVSWQLVRDHDGTSRLHVTHLGRGLPPVARQLLGENLSRHIGEELNLKSHGLSARPLWAREARALSWWQKVQAELGAIEKANGLHACVELPPRPQAKPTDEEEEPGDEGEVEADRPPRVIPNALTTQAKSLGAAPPFGAGPLAYFARATGALPLACE